MSQTSPWARWRLILGEAGEPALGPCLGDQDQARDRALGFLYDREYGAGRNVRADRGSSLDESQLSVIDWINQVHKLFPKETIERLEKDGLERYQLTEMVTNPDLLQRVKPSLSLLRAVLHTKHLMNADVLAQARDLVRQVVAQLIERLARPMRSAFLGAVDPRRPSRHRIAKNFDAKTTIERNLAHYDPRTKRIFIERPFFFSRVRNHVDRWQIIICIDQSGSMVDSLIHASVTAAIFFGISHVRTHLCLFDTNVVDVTADCTDPVETLMKVQLGGGTDIGHALRYAEQLVDNPSRTVVVLVTDFFEGAPLANLLAVTKRLLDSGVTLLGLAALDQEAHPAYDRDVAGQMVELGAHVGAMTPGQLAEWIAEKVR